MKLVFGVVYILVLGISCDEIGALNTGGGLLTASDAFGVPCSDSTPQTYERIYGYLPYSKVTDHNAIDLDQAAMETQLGLRTSAGMTAAKAIYTQGGNSKVYAEFTGTAAAAYTTAGKCHGRLADGSASGPMSLKSAVTSGANAVFKCLYPTTAVQATYQACRVGGLQTTTTTGCIDPAQTITITESGVATTTIAAGTNPTITNKAGRTLQGFGLQQPPGLSSPSTQELLPADVRRRARKEVVPAQLPQGSGDPRKMGVLRPHSARRMGVPDDGSHPLRGRG